MHIPVNVTVYVYNSVALNLFEYFGVEILRMFKLSCMKYLTDTFSGNIQPHNYAVSKYFNGRCDKMTFKNRRFQNTAERVI